MFFRGILAFDARIRVRGSLEHRLPNIASLVFLGILSEVMLVELDRAGIMAPA